MASHPRPLTLGKRSPTGQTARPKVETSGIYRTPFGDHALAAERFEMVGRIESGLKVVVVDEIATDLALPALAVRRLAKISSSTFNRRQKKGFLSAEESDRIFRLRSIVDKATAFFEGNKAAARDWLNRPAPALGGIRPIDMLINEAGVREVEALLGRLEYGVFT